MKPYRILKTFNGSQHGNDFATFVAGTVSSLSAALAAIVVKEGWAEPVAPVGIPVTVATGEVEEVTQVYLGESLVEDRETKVIAPEATKPDKKKKGK